MFQNDKPREGRSLRAVFNCSGISIKTAVGSRAIRNVAHNDIRPYYGFLQDLTIRAVLVMTSGRYELDEHGRRHFLPSTPILPRLEEVIDGLLPAIEALREFDRRLIELGASGTSGRLFARLDAVHSSGAEGSTTTFTELMDFTVRPAAVPSPMEAAEIATLAEAVDEMADQQVDPVDAILQLHRRLFENAADRFKAEGAGRFKTYANATTDDTQPDGWFRYTKPSSLPKALASWRAFTMETSHGVPELIRQACSHWMFEHIHPVPDGNGRVGRLLVPLICSWKGVTRTASAFIGEAVHENKDNYIDGLKAARTMNDMTPFVRLFLSFVQQNAVANIGRIDQMETLRRDWQRATQSLRPHSAIHPALLWISDYPVFSVGSMANGLAISFATANQVVKKLSELGILAAATKDGRNRVFRVPAVLEVFDRFAKKSA